MSEFATVAGALTHLATFETSDAVAGELKRRGIRSKPGCPESCAVADYISESVGVFSVTVDGDEAIGFYGATYELDDLVPEGPYRTSIPDSVREFITDFDCGRYPGLISTSWNGVSAYLYEMEDAA